MNKYQQARADLRAMTVALSEYSGRDNEAHYLDMLSPIIDEAERDAALVIELRAALESCMSEKSAMKARIVELTNNCNEALGIARGALKTND